MALRFGGLLIPGTVLNFPVPIREKQIKETHFFGVAGVSQITGAPGGRTLMIPMLVFERSSRFSTPEKLKDYLLNIVAQQQHKVGVLDTGGGLVSGFIFPECCFHDFMIRPFPGIIQDVAGTLGGGYFCEVDFTFRQL